MVSIVGDGLTTASRALPRFLGVLAEASIDPRAVHAGPLRIAATIDAVRLADAQRVVHAAFVVESMIAAQRALLPALGDVRERPSRHVGVGGRRRGVRTVRQDDKRAHHAMGLVDGGGVFGAHRHH